MPYPGQEHPNSLRKGERSTLERLRIAIDQRGESDPLMRECLDILANIASGNLRTRYIGDQYRAIREILDRTVGKPVERVQHGGAVEHVVRIIEGDGNDG